MFNVYLQGFAIGLSLIVAIGAQNAFVLKQGLKRQYVFWICVLCAGSDAILIALGVMGFGNTIQQFPLIVQIAKYAGALFLLIYGAMHFKQAWQAGQSLLVDDQDGPSLEKTLMICLALTWLNPHVYLDTVILLGSISVHFSEFKIYFALGAMLASVVFFFSLGYAARYLLPVFKSSRAWQILDAIIGLIMWGIALALLLT
ncbi:LysE/ArgO family amino acid transporter [Acinetobacter bouvetii]|uniref:Arginine exporter protein ArgO n=1 Tax=Acinetobacter bouvetii TaxID=202951 RepID=A0A811G7S5_9GAMM|nr:LysE/ArgO family amino acid transporter [Acinetobacter bouvetii]CAB1211100.1 Arginine exporter protein ArgO [Acinetobacter bouvetii]